jgi:hypothetical protein
LPEADKEKEARRRKRYDAARAEMNVFKRTVIA